MITPKPNTREALKLFHDGSVALARMKSNGIRVDVDYLTRVQKEIDQDIKTIEVKLKEDDVYRVWRKRYGSKSKLSSPDQLAKIMFGVMGYESVGTTRTKKAKTDEEAFAKIDLPFIREYFKWKKLHNLKSTYFSGIARELCDDLVHPSFNLHTVDTFRSSSTDPNFQNIPNRNPELASRIRPCYIPREGNHLVELDYSQIEVRVGACYHHDPNMIAYIEDPSTCMHRDMAAELFFFSQEFLVKNAKWAKKTVRDWAKNRFVFPEFYGSAFFQCAPHIWEAVTSEGPDGLPKLPDGRTTIVEHLKKHGIKELGEVKGLTGQRVSGRIETKRGTFMEHVRVVEERMWNQRFPQYTAWKKEWYDNYHSTCRFHMHTGFTFEGLLDRNQVLNSAIQGSAFHCLLWSIIRLQKYIDKHKLRTKIVGEIHDCMVLDVPPEELQEVLSMARTIMTKRLMKAWPWIIVPIETESEVTPVNSNWQTKEQWVANDKGIWGPVPKKV